MNVSSKLGSPFCALAILAAFPLCVLRVSASPLYVGPILLTGAGNFGDPDLALGEGLPGTVGMALSAFGSNGVDWVSLLVSEVDQGGFIGFPSVGSTMQFSADLSQCMAGFSNIFPSLQCAATIDGISGIGSFANLGGGVGVVQVFASTPGPPMCRGCPQPGPLLAEAEVISYATFMSVTPSGYGPEFQSAFALDAPNVELDSSGVPEPSTGILALIGVAALVCLRLISASSRK